MESEPLIRCQDVSKIFCRDLRKSLYYGVQDIFADLGYHKKRSAQHSSDINLRKQEFWANRDISFELQRGECLGLIGRNGAGKTTLLKMLNGLIKPDTGRIEINGSIGALIALGAGFNPILTGRENIFVNGSILGLSRKTIREKFDAIVEFSELEEFIDTPVQSYSSGMQVRLGFSIACQVRPDILLVDEVLAVGDSRFRAKCYRSISGMLSTGTSVIFVSHSESSILAICQRCLYLANGELIEEGETSEVLRKYNMNEQFDELIGISIPQEQLTRETQTGLRIENVSFQNLLGEIIPIPTSGETISICLAVKAEREWKGVSFGVTIRGTQECESVVLSYTSAQDGALFNIHPGTQNIRLTFPNFALIAGNYALKVHAKIPPVNILDVIENGLFRVDGPMMGTATINLQRNWSE